MTDLTAIKMLLLNSSHHEVVAHERGGKHLEWLASGSRNSRFRVVNDGVLIMETESAEEAAKEYLKLIKV